MSPEICERTFEFARRILRVCQALERRGPSAKTLALQLLRSGTSVGANVEEAQGGQSRADFIAKYSIAHKELRETAYWLKLIGAEGVLPDGRLQELMAECEELRRIISTIIIRAKSRTKTPS